MTRKQATLTIKLGNDVKAAIFPRVPIRMDLRRAHHHALGFTDEDIAAIAARNEDDPPITPTHEPDNHAAMMVCLAALGTCLPELWVTPTFRECRHDAIEYGEHVFEHLFGLGEACILRDARDEGARLLKEMYRDAFAGLFAEVAAAEVPTGDPGETSTTPTPPPG